MSSDYVLHYLRPSCPQQMGTGRQGVGLKPQTDEKGRSKADAEGGGGEQCQGFFRTLLPPALLGRPRPVHALGT